LTGLRIGIVGAGLSGLATSFYLKRALPGADLVVFEAEPAPGGKLQTEEVEEFRFEAGANGFLTNKPDSLRLVEDSGVPVSRVQYFREAYVDRRGDGYARARLTLDREVSAAARPDGRRLYGPSDVELIPRDWMVMELKYSRDRPRWMREICRELRLRALPVPKFGLSVARSVRTGCEQEQRRLMPRSIRQVGWSP